MLGGMDTRAFTIAGEVRRVAAQLGLGVGLGLVFVGAAHAGSAAKADTLCLLVQAAAKSNDLPVAYFTRVIWQESRFQPDAVGPLTRSGERAQGIAQFMPGTAAEQNLHHPFDPVQALPKAAAFLQALRIEFGNLGLAAAAYNAGPQRVRDWLSGSRSMPAQTRHYVFAITGRAVEAWKLAKDDKLAVPPMHCRDMMAMLEKTPSAFTAELERRIALGAAQPWGVQLAAGFSRERALSSYARAMKRLGSVIGDRDPMIIGRLLRSRGTRRFYEVRIGTPDGPAANKLCGRIRRAGGACLVLRSRR